MNVWMDENMPWFPGWARGLGLVLATGAILVWAWIKGTDTIEHDSLGIRTLFKKIPLRYKHLGKLDKQTLAEYKKIDKELVGLGRPAKYGRPITREPGFQFMFPGAHKMVKQKTIKKTYDLDTFTVLSKIQAFLGATFENVKVTVQPADIYLWLMGNEDIQSQVRAVCNTALDAIVYELGYEQLMAYNRLLQKPSEKSDSTKDSLTDLLHKRVESDLKEIGVELVSLHLGQSKPLTAEGWIAEAISSLKRQDSITQKFFKKILSTVRSNIQS